MPAGAVRLSALAATAPITGLGPGAALAHGRSALTSRPRECAGKTADDWSTLSVRTGHPGRTTEHERLPICNLSGARTVASCASMWLLVMDDEAHPAAYLHKAMR